MFGEDYIIKWLNSLPLKYQLSLGIILLSIFNMIILIGLISGNVFLLTNSIYLDLANYIDNREYSQLDNHAEFFDLCIYSYLVDEKDYTNVLKNLKKNIENNSSLVPTYSSLSTRYTDLEFTTDSFITDTSKTSNDYANSIGVIDNKYDSAVKSSSSYLKALNTISNLLPLFKWIRKVRLFQLDPDSKLFDYTKSDLDKIFINYDDLKTTFYYPSRIGVYTRDSLYTNTTSSSQYENDSSDIRGYLKSTYTAYSTQINLINSTIDYYLSSNSSDDITSNNENNTYIHQHSEEQYELERHYPIHLDSKDKFFNIPAYLNNDDDKYNMIMDSTQAQIVAYLLDFEENTEQNNYTGSIIINKGTWITDSIIVNAEYSSSAIRLLILDLDTNFTAISKFECLRMIRKAHYLYNNNKFHPEDFGLSALPIIKYNDTDDSDTQYTYLDLNSTIYLNQCLSSYSYNSTSEFFTLDYEYFNHEIQLYKLTDNSNNSTRINLTNINNFDLNSNLEVKAGNDTYKITNKLIPLSLVVQDITITTYPIEFLYLSFIFKSDGLSKNITKSLYINSISSFITSLIASLIINYSLTILIMFSLYDTMAMIEKPLNLIDEAIKSISEPEKFKDSKAKLENYILTEKNFFDEFVDLVKIILDMIQGNMDSENREPVSKETKQYLDSRDIQRDFSVIKINNIMIFENKLKNKIVSDSYFKQIQQIDMNEILGSETVTNSRFFIDFIINYNKEKDIEKLNYHNEELDPQVIENKQMLKPLNFPFDKKKNYNYKQGKSMYLDDVKENKENSNAYNLINNNDKEEDRNDKNKQYIDNNDKVDKIVEKQSYYVNTDSEVDEADNYSDGSLGKEKQIKLSFAEYIEKHLNNKDNPFYDIYAEENKQK